jgi:type IV secretion system protein VirB3
MNTLNISTIFAGLTRPPMIMGVTVDYLSVCFMLSVIFFILSNSFEYLLVYIPLHCLGWLACKLDHHIFRLFSKKLQCQNVPNKRLWGCQTYEPL